MTTISIIDHTADIGLEVTAPNAAEAFIATAEGMFDIMLKRDRQVPPTERLDLRLEADNWEDLLVLWLEELLYRYESENVLPADISIREVSSESLRADIAEEPLDIVRHEPRVQIKAVTYHQLRVEETPDGFEIRVIFDI